MLLQNPEPMLMTQKSESVLSKEFALPSQQNVTNIGNWSTHEEDLDPD